MKDPAAATDFSKVLPIVFGGDVGAYTLGLESYQAFGVGSVCIAHQPVDLITRSRIFDVVSIGPQASDEERLKTLRKVADANPGRDYLLLTNNDGLVGFLTRHRDTLGPEFVMPFPDAKIVRLLSSKTQFAEVCERAGAPTPPSLVVDLAEGAEGTWSPPSVPFRFPLVGKPDSTDEYEKVSFPGKEKVYYLDNQEQLDRLWSDLRGAGYQGTFLVQELIPGTDWDKRTVTMYVDSNGRTTMRAAGQVLLEDPTPTMIGNPSAMITRDMPKLWKQGEAILQELGYRGFANFDLIVDPRDGVAYFFELNPRAGRSSYFVVAGGVNPVEVAARDLILGQKLRPVQATRRALYTLLPVPLILHYVTDKKLKKEVRELVRERRVVNPLRAKVEGDLKRRLVVELQGLNFYRKFAKHYRRSVVETKPGRS